MILAGSITTQVCFAGSVASHSSLSALHTSGTTIADEKNQPVVLRGCNLGNWFLIEPWMLGLFDRANLHDQSQVEQMLTDRFGVSEKDHILDLYRENWISQRDFGIIKSWRFNVVRLPFHYSLLEDDAKPGELRPDAFHWLDRAVSMAQQAGIYVILDLHGAPGGQSLDGVTGKAGSNQFWLPANRQRGAFIWQKIAEHYRDNPTVAAYDLLNEPYGSMDSSNHDAVLLAAMDEMIHAIRQFDDHHIIFCAGSLRGIEMYDSLLSHGWKNVGLTEHFYPGVYGGTPSLETHASFIGSNLGARDNLLRKWNVPYFCGEFNVVFDRAGGAEMMRRYFDLFQSHGWAAASWAYKLIKAEGGVQPNHWYMVTNRDPLKLPDFSSDSAEEIEAFCRSLGTMDYAQDIYLRDTLTANTPPPLLLGKYAPVVLPAKCETLPGWMDSDVGDAFPKGGHTMSNEVMQLFGGGRDIYEGSDEFHFVSRPTEGDCSLRADVTPPTDSNIYAKSGIMFRESLAADAPFVMINLLPEGRCVFAYRQQAGKRVDVGELRFDAGASTLCLARRGEFFEVSAFAKDGTKLAAKSVEMKHFATRGNIGCFVLSHDEMQLSEAMFSRITLETSKTTHNTIPSP